ncbi:MAG: hypothetical protein F6K41_28765 [Symploca sp. SIO3E6]|nr:hypothetical protein [Caldora sp. SIO3E6]
MWIFMDINGVLVPDKFTFPVSKEDLVRFEPTCLQMFEAVLQRYPQVLVVISSSWKEVFPFEVVHALFSPSIAQRVVGFTPFLNPKIIHKLPYLRHQEVLEFLRLNNASDEPWVAIDDIREHYPPHVPVIVTDANTGFEQSAALALEKYLQEMATDNTKSKKSCHT